jgi:hypothetical protein
MNLEFSRQDLEKSSNVKFHATLSIESRVVPFEHTDRRTDRRDETDSRFINLSKKRYLIQSK